MVTTTPFYVGERGAQPVGHDPFGQAEVLSVRGEWHEDGTAVVSLLLVAGDPAVHQVDEAVGWWPPVPSQEASGRVAQPPIDALRYE